MRVNTANICYLLLLLSVVALIGAYTSGFLGNRDHRTSLIWTDYRRGNPPMVVRIKDSETGPTPYYVTQGKRSSSGYVVTAQYEQWVATICELLPALLNEKPSEPLAAEMTFSQGTKEWTLRIGKTPSPASSKLLKAVGDKLPGLDGPP